MNKRLFGEFIKIRLSYIPPADIFDNVVCVAEVSEVHISAKNINAFLELCFKKFS